MNKRLKSSSSIGILMILGILISSCGETTDIITEKPSSKDMQSINPLIGNIEIVQGEKANYTGSVHGSVGIQKKCWSKDESILKLIDREFTYNKPLVDGETGGDAAKEKYIFEALNPGTTEVVIQEWYRGDLENEYLVEVIVKSK